MWLQVFNVNDPYSTIFQVQDESDKNHLATDNPNDTIGEGRMYEKLGNPMCPVTSFKRYISKLHPGINALWQQPRDTFDPSDNIWYCKTPIGKNTLSTMMAKISKLSKLSTVYTNHSIRATAITEMDAAGIDTRHIMRVSGHKSDSSIKHYVERLTENKKREISDCLGEKLMGATAPKCAKTQTPVSTSTSSLPLNTISPSAQNVANSQVDIADYDFQDLMTNSTEVSSENVPIHQSGPLYNVAPVQNNSAVQNNNLESTNRNVMPYITNNNCTVNFHFHAR